MRKYKNFNDIVKEVDVIDFSKFMTLLWFTFISTSGSSLIWIFQFISFIGIICFSRLKNNRWFWSVLSISFTIVLVDHFQFADNHKWLYMYWLFNLTINGNDKESLIKNSRLMLAFVFFFATFWKVYSGEYTDGTFFEISFLADSRFRDFITNFLGYSVYDAKYATYLSDQFYLNEKLNPTTYNNAFYVNRSNQVVATITSYYTLFMEASLCLLYFFKNSLKIENLADYFLLIFMLTVYTILPVMGFATVLWLIGFSQANSKVKPVYIMTLIILIFLATPIYG